MGDSAGQEGFTWWHSRDPCAVSRTYVTHPRHAHWFSIKWGLFFTATNKMNPQLSSPRKDFQAQWVQVPAFPGGLAASTAQLPGAEPAVAAGGSHGERDLMQRQRQHAARGSSPEPHAGPTTESPWATRPHGPLLVHGPRPVRRGDKRRCLSASADASASENSRFSGSRSPHAGTYT